MVGFELKMHDPCHHILRERPATQSVYAFVRQVYPQQPKLDDGKEKEHTWHLPRYLPVMFPILVKPR
jgi:hypothetical protein